RRPVAAGLRRLPQPNTIMNSTALVVATGIGTVLQLAMVIAGHSNKSIAALFGILGVSISLIVGVVYAVRAKQGSTMQLALGGLVAGGLCALIGIIVSYMLGDVPALILLVGTTSSAVTGAIGGAAGRLFARGSEASVPSRETMRERVERDQF